MQDMTRKMLMGSMVGMPGMGLPVGVPGPGLPVPGISPLASLMKLALSADGTANTGLEPTAMLPNHGFSMDAAGIMPGGTYLNEFAYQNELNNRNAHLKMAGGMSPLLGLGGILHHYLSNYMMKNKEVLK